MTDKKQSGLSRRKILAGLGTIGVASAGAGLGTSALFRDTEKFEGNTVTAGELDLGIDYDSEYYDDGATGQSTGSGFIGFTSEGEAIFDLSDVKPGDKAVVEFCFQQVNNPAFLWFCGQLQMNSQGLITEPEQQALANYENVSTNSSYSLTNETYVTDVVDEGEKKYDMGDWGGQLAQEMQLNLGYTSPSGNGALVEDPFDTSVLDSGNTILSNISLAEALASGLSIPLDATQNTNYSSLSGNQTAFNATSEANSGPGGSFENPCLRLELIVPEETGNLIQDDTVEFGIRFHASQARNNNGDQSPCGFEDGSPGGGGGV